MERKNVREYQDFYVQSNTLFLANGFRNFRNMCLEIYGLDIPKFLSAPGLAWQVTFKKTKVKVNLLDDINVANRKKRYQRKNMSFFLSMCKN